MGKITFIVYDFSVLGGVEIVTARVANALSQLGYDVSVVSVIKERKAVAQLLHKQVHCYYIFEKEVSFWKLALHFFNPVKKFFLSHPADVVFLMGIGALKPCLFLRWLYKAKVVYCDHGALINQLDNKKVTLFRFLATKTVHRITTLTLRNRNDYIATFHVPPQKIFCIYNWAEEVPKDEIVPFEERKPLIISGGRFSPEKGMDMLVEVAEKVLMRFPQWEWHVYGDGPCFLPTKKLIEEKHLEKNLILKGQVEQLSSCMPGYSIFVLTSYREGMPLVLLEAKSRGIPAVSFDVATGPKEIIQDGLNGDLVPPYDKEKMADRICRLIENTELRRNYAKHTSEEMTQFNKKTVLKQWILLIESLSK